MTAGIDLRYCDIIIMVTRTAEKVVIDVEETESCDRLTINAVPLVQYMRKAMDALQQI
jgi:hypothetical protein